MTMMVKEGNSPMVPGKEPPPWAKQILRRGILCITPLKIRLQMAWAVAEGISTSLRYHSITQVSVWAEGMSGTDWSTQKHTEGWGKGEADPTRGASTCCGVDGWCRACPKGG
jgi:hypothetical protein